MDREVDEKQQQLKSSVREKQTARDELTIREADLPEAQQQLTEKVSVAKVNGIMLCD